MSLRETAKQKRRQRILGAARGLIELEGVGGLSMRRLAEEAELSTRTLYNLYGAKETIIYALMSEMVEELDRALGQLATVDPIEQSRGLIEVSIDNLLRRESLNRSLMREIELNAHRAREPLLLARGRELHQEPLRRAMTLGLLDARFSPVVLAHQLLFGLGQAVRLWARGTFDGRALRAQSLHVWAVHLLAVATETARPRLQREVMELRTEIESVMEQLDRIIGSEVSEFAGPRPAAVAASAGSAADPAPDPRRHGELVRD